MAAPGQVFANNFMQGFGLMDAYYDRKDRKQRSMRAETRAIESHGLNMAAARTSNSVNEMKLDGLKDTKNASTLSSIFNDDKGGLIDFKSLTPEQLKGKTGQLVNFLKQDPKFKKMMVDANPAYANLNDLNLIHDKKTGKAMIAMSVVNDAGDVKPLTLNRSSDPNDQVKLMSMEDAYNGLKSMYGEQMGTRISPKTAAKRKHSSDVAAQDHKNKLELAHIKAGTSPGSKGNNKQVVALKKNVYGLNNSNYGAAGLNGTFSFEGDKGAKRNMANVVADHMINSGQGSDAGTVSARSIQTVDNIYKNGGSIKNVDGKWLAYTGEKDESGKPIIQELFSDQKPTASSGGKNKPDSGKKPVNNQQDTNPNQSGKKTAKKTPTWSEYLPAAKKANKGVSDKAHRAEYNKRYRANKAESDKQSAHGLSDAGKQEKKNEAESRVKNKMNSMFNRRQNKPEGKPAKDNNNRGTINRKGKPPTSLAEAKKKPLDAKERRNHPRLKKLYRELSHNGDSLSHQEKVSILAEINEIEGFEDYDNES